MEVELNLLWDGSAAPAGMGGKVSLQRDNALLRVDWNLRLPGTPRTPPGPVGFTEGLWEWDVLEVFLRGDAPGSNGHQRYVELELGPAGHWLALAFHGVRRRAAELRELAPKVGTRVEDGVWTGHAEWQAAELEAHSGKGPWAGLVTAVLGEGASRAYLSFPSLPGFRADFHQPQAWTPLSLEAPWVR